MKLTRVVLVTLMIAACGGSEGRPGSAPDAGGSSGGTVAMPGTGGAAGVAVGGTGGAAGAPPDTTPPGPVAAEDQGCPDIFTQDRMRTYEIEIDPAEWDRLEAEFRAGPPLNSMNEVKTYYPVRSLRYGNEVRTDASIRLRGSSSWAFTIMEDPKPKAQFQIAFDKNGTEVAFHGVNRVTFDMPRLDWTMLHERLAYAYMRVAGLPAPCANSAQLIINGQLYGVYVTKEHYGGRLLKRLFPGASEGALLQSGMFVQENSVAYNPARVMQFWLARDMSGMLPIIDVEHALRVWAAEVLINDADGYWGGDHNFLTYDHPQRGFVWLSDDPDASFEWLGMMQHPIYWWQGRIWVPPAIGQHYLAVINDPTWRGKFVSAIAANLEKWDVARIQGWIDRWSAQIADAASRDPRRPFSVGEHQSALAAARAMVSERAAYLRSFLSCERGGAADDHDQDGFPWCRDCDDARPDSHPGAPEICGDMVDQDCDGVKNDGC